jgi:hypothetical protein
LTWTGSVPRGRLPQRAENAHCSLPACNVARGRLTLILVVDRHGALFLLACCMHGYGEVGICLDDESRSQPRPGKIPALDCVSSCAGLPAAAVPVVVEQKQASLWHHKTTRQRAAAAAVVQRRWRSRFLSRRVVWPVHGLIERPTGSRAERGLVQVLSVPAIGTAKPCMAAIHACTQPHQ